MNSETIEALRASIARHKKNLKAETVGMVRLGSDYCALCALFIDDDCVGCPVSVRTKRVFCRGTPYGKLDEACEAWEEAEFSSVPEDCLSAREAFRAAERKEIKFLESLLPEGL